MNNRDRFFEAFAHTGHRVMGRELVKFTLRHRFWLEVFESPVVMGGEVTLVDLEGAAMLCAIPYADLDRLVPQLISRRPTRWARLRFLLRTLRSRADREYGALMAYLLDHGCPPVTHGEGIDAGEEDGPPVPPHLKKKEHPDRFGTLPGLLSLVTGLIRRTKWDPGVVWGLGPGEAEWYLTGVLLHSGVDVPLKTPSDEEFEEGLRREREEAAAKVTRAEGDEAEGDTGAADGTLT